MSRKSANEIIEEAKDTPEAQDVMFYALWKQVIRDHVRDRGLTMDDQVFVLSDNGTEWVIVDDADTTSDAYDRAMKGI